MERIVKPFLDSHMQALLLELLSVLQLLRWFNKLCRVCMLTDYRLHCPEHYLVPILSERLRMHWH